MNASHAPAPGAQPPTITVNGEQRPLPQGQTLRALIEALGLGTHAVAAEVNGKLVPRRQQDDRTLAPGDRIELVSLVGGG